jgi:hypothetical protein
VSLSSGSVFAGVSGIAADGCDTAAVTDDSAAGGAAAGLNVASSLLSRLSTSTWADWRSSCTEPFLMTKIAGVLLMGRIGVRKEASWEPARSLRATAPV